MIKEYLWCRREWARFDNIILDVDAGSGGGSKR